jgi:hypothetical protein
MANLNGQNIGTNYKGFLNLDSTINTPLDATLRAVTDGMGTSSPLQLSTTKVAIGTILYFNGITSSFPAIKRNGAAIDFRLADDSGYANISMNNLNCSGIIYYGGNNESISSSGNSGYTDFRSNQGWQFTNADGSSVYQRFTSAGISFGDSTLVASAQVTINSTTKGFLMPRQTTAQINAISTPANGLQVYNTDLNVICFYDGTGWHKVTHTNM